MSPQTRRGRGTPANRRTRPQAAQAPSRDKATPPSQGKDQTSTPAASAAPKPTPAPAPVASTAPAAEADEEEPAGPRTRAELRADARAEARTEGRRARMAPQKRRRQHGLAYRWLAAWFPIFAGLMVFLGALWVYTSFIKAPSLKQQWATIESKWSPARDASRAKLSTLAKATPFDLTAYQAEAKNYEAQITGWVDDVKKVGDWGPDANNAEQTFVNVGGELVAALKQAETVKTVADLAPLQDTITSLDTTFSEAVYGPTGVRVALQLPLPGATPSPMTFPFPSIAPSPTAGPSGSEAPSGSPLASPTAALPTASATP